MERVGPYEIHEQLGRGGMGAVFRAVDTRTAQEVALKLLPAADERARRRFLLEARALARLRHRNLVSLLDAGEDRGLPWLALELVRGPSLQVRLDRAGPLAPRDAAALVRGLAAGLAHAHREGVLHRDLKPGNVLLPDGEGEPKLTDFGLAGFTFDLSQSRLTKSGTFMGSPGYWAPEQASGQASALGPHTDVYGLGAVLYAALTGRAPIVGESLPEILVATERQRPEAPRSGDRVLDAIALRCLAKAPADRFGSVDEVARELSRYLVGRTAPGRRSRSGGAALAALVVLVGVGAWLGSGSPPASQGPGIEDALAEPPPTTEPPGSTPAMLPRPVDDVGADVDVDEVEAPFVSAVALLARRDFREAIVHLDRAIERDPRDALALASRGWAKLELEDPAGAIVDCDRAIELDSRTALAYAARGGARSTLGDGEGAIADLDRAIELDPRSVLAYTSRAAYKSEAGDLVGAIADNDRAIELDPRNALAYMNRGNAKVNLGDTQGGIADQGRAIELHPSNRLAYMSRGAARLRLGDVDGAIADLDRAIELDSRHAFAFRTRGSARLERGDFHGAIQDLDRAIDLDPSHALAFKLRGGARLGMGDHAGAIADFDQAIERDPGSSVAHQNRGMARLRLGDLQGAITDHDRAVELDPRDARAYLTRSDARELLGDQLGMIADWEAALRLEPDASWAESLRNTLKARTRLEER